MKPRKPRKPTTRQLYILGYAVKGLLRIRPYGSAEFIRPYIYAPGAAERMPSIREMKALLEAGWATVIPDPKNYIEDTRTGERTYGSRVIMTADGLAQIVHQHAEAKR